jgi:hypothetical protein
METKLTGRQREFLSQFLDVYWESGEPLHYSAVADRLGVSPITAYDMLRILEGRRLLASEYILPVRGPGRSTIVFRPTEEATTLMTQLAGEGWEREEWETAKERILQAVREARGTDYQGLLETILLRIPERKSPMTYVTEMMTAILLHLHQLTEEAKGSSVLESLRSLGLPAELAGLTVGLGFVERANRRVISLLLSYSRKYQEYMARLSSESKQRLSDFAEEVMRIVET